MQTSFYLTPAIFAAVLAGLLGSATAPAASAGNKDASPRVDEIITIGTRDKALAELPRSAVVITDLDIALSPSNSLVDLIAREANIVLRSTSGTEKRAGVDIRGQGDTYTSNVLVLIDGFAINAADLSGADYAAVPLEQIQRIEIVRGANTVRYGSGAVSGVINIITRAPDPGVGASARLRTGSYNTVNAGGTASWSGETLTFGTDVNYYDTDGYRDNSGLEKKDVILNAGYQPLDWLEFGLYANFHRDKFGLPGPVSKTEFDGSDADRTQTTTPLNGGNTEDDRYRADVLVGNDTTGRLQLTGYHREREEEALICICSENPPPPGLIDESSDQLLAQYEYEFMWRGLQHALYVGADSDATDYTRVLQQGSVPIYGGDIDQYAWFTAVDLSLSQNLRLSAGYRSDRFKLTQSEENFGPPEVITNRWRNEAAELGLVYEFDDSTNVYFSFAQSFRNPNVDELVFQENDVNDEVPPLSPQSGDHWNAGMRQLLGLSLEWSLNVFYSETENEILFGIEPALRTPVNRNADQPVERTGGEAEVRWDPVPSLLLVANAGYVDAEFTETRTEVPLVPEWTGALSVEWQPVNQWTIAMAGNYVGERYEGNDYSNTQPELDSYVVVDTRISYQVDGWQLFAGINNLFNEIYATDVFSGGYYPMPTRNYYAGVVYRM